MRRPTIDGSICQQTQHCEHRTIQHDKTHSKLHGATALKKDILRCSRQSHCTTWSRKDRHPSKLSHSRNVFAFSLPNLSSHCCSHQLRVCPIGLPRSAPRCSPPLITSLFLCLSDLSVSVCLCVSLALSFFYLASLFLSLFVCCLSLSLCLCLSLSLALSFTFSLSLYAASLFLSMSACCLTMYLSVPVSVSRSLALYISQLFAALFLTLSAVCLSLSIHPVYPQHIHSSA